MSIRSQTILDYQRILLFVRAPQRGHVKTRLARRLGADQTLALYRCFVEDIITTLKIGPYPTSIFYTPADQGSALKAWLGSCAGYHPQIGIDLGQRMQTAFNQTFCEPVKHAVLIGSDFPDLDIEVIREAFTALQENEVVIGPATDGGYYLIGFQKNAVSSDIFNGVEWGTSQVFQQTLALIQAAKLRYHTLPAWQDIDTYDDLLAFYARNASINSPRLKSMSLLSRILQQT